MHGLNSRIVKQRVLRRHYGIATSVAWNNERHPLERRWKDKLDGTWRVDVMRWYAQKVWLSWLSFNSRASVLKTVEEWRLSCITTSTTARSWFENVNYSLVIRTWPLCIQMIQVLATSCLADFSDWTRLWARSRSNGYSSAGIRSQKSPRRHFILQVTLQHRDDV
jgi:hypothetical protein